MRMYCFNMSLIKMSDAVIITTETCVRHYQIPKEVCVSFNNHIIYFFTAGNHVSVYFTVHIMLCSTWIIVCVFYHLSNTYYTSMFYSENTNKTDRFDND